MKSIKVNMLVEKAFNDLFPEKDSSDYEFSLRYHNKFKPFNANVRYRGKGIHFNLSKKWRKVSEEIQIGLIQELLLKVFKEKRKTMNIELYNIFMKKVHIAVPKTKSDPILEESFHRINEKYFFGMIEKPNLKWGSYSSRKLGSYEYGSDTVTISRILEDEEFLIDYIMYHELLHKKHKFKYKNGRNFHHTKEFKTSEREFEGRLKAESMISKIIGRYRRKRLFRGFFSL